MTENIKEELDWLYKYKIKQYEKSEHLHYVYDRLCKLQNVVDLCKKFYNLLHADHVTKEWNTERKLLLEEFDKLKVW